jgi:hypothetical protein
MTLTRSLVPCSLVLRIALELACDSGRGREYNSLPGSNGEIFSFLVDTHAGPCTPM